MSGATVQILPDPIVANLEAIFQKRLEPNFAFKSAASVGLTTGGLRGFWPMSVFDANGTCIDISDVSNDLTNVSVCEYGYDGLAPYVQFDGASDYLYRTDNADIDLIGNEAFVVTPGVTMGGWFYADSSLATAQLMGKGAAGLGTGSYGLQFTAAGESRGVIVDAAGAVLETVTSTQTVGDGEWFFAAMQWNPSTTFTAWLNSDDTSQASAIATLQNTAVNFQIGAFNTTTAPFPGRASMCWLCNAFLSNSIITAIYEQTRVMYGKV